MDTHVKLYYKTRPFVVLFILWLVPFLLTYWYGLENLFIVSGFGFLFFLSSILFMIFCTFRGGGHKLHRSNMYFIGFLAYLISFTIINLCIGWLLPISSKNAVHLIFLISIILTIYSSLQANKYKNYEQEIEIDGLSEALTIYHAPDVHFGAFAGRERAKKLVEDINKIRPDLVIFNGDFIDSKIALTQENLEPFKEAQVPLYFTFGNHDTYVGPLEIRAYFSACGINILENEIIEVKNTQILGLDHLNADEFSKDGHGSKKKETIKSILPTININKDKPLVVALHKPIGIEYISEAGADLILCGHTHAGQIFPATLISIIQFKYLKGLYKYNNTQIYVSKGVGTFGPPMRLGAEAEATIIKLIPAKKK